MTGMQISHLARSPGLDVSGRGKVRHFLLRVLSIRYQFLLYPNHISNNNCKPYKQTTLPLLELYLGLFTVFQYLIETSVLNTHLMKARL